MLNRAGVFVLLLSLLSIQVYPQWTIKNPKSLGILTPLTNESLFFLNKDIGWCLGESSIGRYLYSTTNGGISWTSQKLPYEKRFIKVFFLDQQNGWITGSDGIIIHTSDGGKNWDLQADNTSNFLEDIHFANLNTGWAVGDKTFLITTDGGKHWQHSKIESAPLDMKVMYLQDAQTGWIGAESYIQSHTQMKIFKTTDGAETWTEYKLGNASYGFRKLVFTDSLNGFAITYAHDSLYYRTEDGGATWSHSSEADLSEYERTNSILFENPKLGWLTTDYGRILKTTNGGRSWVQVLPGSNYSIDDFFYKREFRFIYS